MSARRRLGPRARAAGGFTLVELLAVLAILGIVLGALTTVFARSLRAETDANNRFQAQNQARLAVDRMRREIHCASGVTSVSSSSVTVTLPGQCPFAVGGATTTILYTLQSAGTDRYRLNRAVNGGAAVMVSDYLTSGTSFSYQPPTTALLARLRVLLNVNVNPSQTWKTWRLQTDIVLRNTTRA